MYVPAAFGEKRPEVLHRLIEANSFGLLITGGTDGLFATHLPFLLARDEGENGTLIAHLARANPHARILAGGAEALVVFGGPHGYVSPRWYEQHPAVPTWNYAAVHVYGRPRMVDDPAALRRILEGLVATHEGDGADAWSMAGLPEKYVDGMIRGIVGFKIAIDRIEGKIKLSQNRSAADRRNVIAALGAGESADDRALGAMMSDLAPPVGADG